MILRYIKPFLDYKEGGEYDVKPDSVAEYHVRLGIAKKVTDKDGKPTKSKPTKVPKAKAPKKAKQEKAPAETKELKTEIENK